MSLGKFFDLVDWAAITAAMWFLSFAILAAILWGTLAPVNPVPRILPWQDKLEHLVAFMALGTAFSLAATHRAFWFVLATTWALAVSVEYAQAIFTLHREFSWRDAAASGLGAIIGTVGGTMMQFMAERQRAVLAHSARQ